MTPQTARSKTAPVTPIATAITFSDLLGLVAKPPSDVPDEGLGLGERARLFGNGGGSGCGNAFELVSVLKQSVFVCVVEWSSQGALLGVFAIGAGLKASERRGKYGR